MTGVEILNEIPIYGMADWVWIVALCLFCVIVLAFLANGVVEVVKKKVYSMGLLGNFMLGLAIATIFSAFWTVMIGTCEVGYDKNNIVDYQYQVVISDDVNFNEFNDKYEIIDQDGVIYTVRERTGDN